MAAVYFSIVISSATLVRRHATYERKDKAQALLSFIQQEEYLTSEDPLLVTWPHPNVLPESFTCDGNGTHFVVSDGLALFTAAGRREGRRDSARFKEARGLKRSKVEENARNSSKSFSKSDKTRGFMHGTRHGASLVRACWMPRCAAMAPARLWRLGWP